MLTSVCKFINAFMLKRWKFMDEIKYESFEDSFDSINDITGKPHRIS